jgi:hypothetical protein
MSQSEQAVTTWVKCPVCGEPGMKCVEEGPEDDRHKLIACVNHVCASNGGDNASALRCEDEEQVNSRGLDDGHHFLRGCHSQPKTLADLAAGDTFIEFPGDGDDSGHGGFKGGGRLLVKIEPYWPGGHWHRDARATCRHYLFPDGDITLPLNYPVIQVHDVAPSLPSVVEPVRPAELAKRRVKHALESADRNSPLIVGLLDRILNALTDEQYLTLSNQLADLL